MDHRRGYLPSPPVTSTGGTRRAQNVSEESASSTESRIDSSDHFRKGGPGYLPSIPTESPLSGANTPSQSQYLVDEAMKLCNLHRIPCNITMILRHSFGLTPKIPQDVTLLILADRETNKDDVCKDDVWVVVINEILELFAKVSFGGRVEFCDPITLHGKYVFSLGPGHELIPRWDALQPKILEVLNGSDWVIMVPLRLGYLEDSSVTTLVITAKTPNSNAWKYILKALKRLLDQELFSNEVGISLEGTTSLWGAFGKDSTKDTQMASIPDEVFIPQQPNLMGLGLQCDYVSNFGTLGGFLRLTNSQGITEVYGLTCHHVTVEDKNGYPLPQDINHNGSGDLRVSPGVYNANLPTRDQVQTVATTITGWLEDINNRVSSNPAAVPFDLQVTQRETNDKLKAIKSHQQNFGNVSATSGFRSVASDGAEWAIDWALIGPTNGRSASNKTWWARDLLTPTISPWHHVRETGFITQSLATARPVHKRGCVTGVTTGKVNEIKLSSHVDGWPSNIANQSYVVVPTLLSQPMAKHGDSGSWLLDDRGKLLGVIHGGDSSRGFCNVIPIHDILRDITHLTGFTVDLNID